MTCAHDALRVTGHTAWLPSGGSWTDGHRGLAVCLLARPCVRLTWGGTWPCRGQAWSARKEGLPGGGRAEGHRSWRLGPWGGPSTGSRGAGEPAGRRLRAVPPGEQPQPRDRRGRHCSRVEAAGWLPTGRATLRA